MEKALLLDLGLTPFAEAWELQKRIWQLRVEGRIPDTLILVEHPAVITLGKSGKAGNLLVSEDELKARGIELFRIERGGDITWHGPGQLVGYPLFFIPAAIAGVRAFVTRVEESLIRALAASGIQAGRKPGLTGVWVSEEKVAALGIAVRKRVSFHGFALNVNPDMTGFQLINPCGIRDKGVTSLARLLNRPVSMPVAKHQVVSAFEKVFDREFVLTSRERILNPCPECYATQNPEL
jgi:lipoyl(octanoyl) transferase